MSTFTDRKGRIWGLELDLFKAKVIDKSDFKEFWDQEFSILEPTRELLQRLMSNSPFLFAIIWAMVHDQAEAKFKTYKQWLDSPKTVQTKRGSICKVESPPRDSFPISPKEEPAAAELEFVSGINGPTIEAGRTAFLEALGEFFPDLRTVLSFLTENQKMMVSKVGARLEKTSPLLERLLDEELDKAVAKLQEELNAKHGEISTPLPVT